MATDVIMPALGMAQETGLLVRWLKSEGATVSEGDAIAEIQTDKATMELEARASGVLAGIVAQEGQDVPVGAVIARILAPGESIGTTPSVPTQNLVVAAEQALPGTQIAATGSSTGASPLATRIASDHGVDLREVRAAGRRVQKADVIAYLETRTDPEPITTAASSADVRLMPASPKARRLAIEHGVDIEMIRGTGPNSAVVTSDVMAASNGSRSPGREPEWAASALHPIWRIMAERTTQSWQEIPHFFLLREVNASRMIAWRERLRRQQEGNVTYTDLLVKVVAQTLVAHPRLNASWVNGGIALHSAVNVGLAVATNDGLVVPVIREANHLSIHEIAQRREELVRRAQAGKQRPDDLAGATFTISNLGMYGVDAFNAIVPAPQAGILAVGRIVERVVPLNGAPAVQPMMALSLSCDHRVVDGARGAQFLGALADLIEEPLALLG